MPAEAPIVGYGVTNALGDLKFENPVGIVSPPGETNRLFIVERTGRIYAVTNLAAPTKTLFLDVTHQLYAFYIEAGLLGLAFHPGYATNRFFYVYRTLFTSTSNTLWGLHDQLSRFNCSPENADVALRESELVLFAQPDRSDTHNGGGLEFGPDGYLYLGMGDETPILLQESPNPQTLDQGLFAGIIRIDVDRRPGSLPPNPMLGGTANYSIPPDNPFVGATNYQGFLLDSTQVRTEFYAIGLRNPWRIAFDVETGFFYCGDVGGGLREEVHLINRGGNYGWPYLEGTRANRANAPTEFQSIPPLYEYGHGNGTNQGAAIIGGKVYRGRLIPQLQAAYVFADYRSGHIWSLRHEGTNLIEWNWLTSDVGVSTFGADPRDGELLIANYDEGEIKRLVFGEPGTVDPLPATLPETGAFADLAALAPHEGILPYEINVPFWSDHAQKHRWFSIPSYDSTVGFKPQGNWEFPAGAVWIKHFDLVLTNGAPPRRLETRFLVKSPRGMYGMTYRWDESQTNAVLVPPHGTDETFVVFDGSNVRTQVWHYPGRAECGRCHTPGGGYALGFNTGQLNRDGVFGGTTVNQLLALSEAGYFSTNLFATDSLPMMGAATNESIPLGWRARSYLAANCSQCHHSHGPGGTPWNARLELPLREATILDAPATLALGPQFRIIKPRVPDESAILYRISSLLPEYRMPKIASSELDTHAIALMREWILGLPPPPWVSEDIGAPLREGSATIADGVLRVGGSGRGIGGTNDTFHYLAQPVSNNFQMIVRMRHQSGNPAGSRSQSGILFRESLEAAARSVAILAPDQSTLRFVRRSTPNSAIIRSVAGWNREPIWLRLTREGERFSAFRSNDGVTWSFAGADEVPMAEDIYAGLVAARGDDAGWNVATYDNLCLVSVRLTAPMAGGSFVASTPVVLAADVQAMGVIDPKVEFFSGSHKVGEAASSPYRFTWTNAHPGSHSMTARVSDGRGAVIVSKPVEIQVEWPGAFASEAQFDSVTGGNWKMVFGTDGFLIAGDATNAPSYGSVLAWNSGVTTTVLDLNPEASSALQRSITGRIAATWTAPMNLSFDLSLPDGQFRQLSCYFLDWDTENQRVQKVEVIEPVSDTILSSVTLSNFSSGQYLSWMLRGRVRILVTSLNDKPPVLSAIFFDPAHYQNPLVNLVEPGDGFGFELPMPLSIEAQVTEGSRPVSRVEFFANGALLETFDTPPYRFGWSNMLAGGYALMARATDNLGISQPSVAVNVTAFLPLAQATFVGEDATTQGNWIDRYGAEGYVVALHATNYPPYALLTAPSNVFPYLAGTHATATPNLQRIDDIARFDGYWFANNEMILDVRLVDGRSHQLALYFVEWPYLSRSFAAEIRDGQTGQALDRREIRQFNSGKYYRWNLRGHVQLRFTLVEGPNVALAGLFLDSPDSLFQHWMANFFGESELADPSITGELADPDADGTINWMEYVAGSHPRDPTARDEMRVMLENSYLTVTYQRNAQAPAAAFDAETSQDLRSWKAAGDEVEVLRAYDQENGQIVTIRLRKKVSDSAAGFLRPRPVPIIGIE